VVVVHCLGKYWQRLCILFEFVIQCSTEIADKESCGKNDIIQCAESQNLGSGELNDVIFPRFIVVMVPASLNHIVVRTGWEPNLIA
jgi:hypothetical protein